MAGERGDGTATARRVGANALQTALLPLGGLDRQDAAVEESLPPTQTAAATASSSPQRTGWRSTNQSLIYGRRRQCVRSKARLGAVQGADCVASPIRRAISAKDARRAGMIGRDWTVLAHLHLIPAHRTPCWRARDALRSISAPGLACERYGRAMDGPREEQGRVYCTRSPSTSVRACPLSPHRRAPRQAGRMH